MIRNYTTEGEQETPKANEPAAIYGADTKRQFRVVTDEELARCMTLEESERLITEKIYRFYHPEA